MFISSKLSFKRPGQIFSGYKDFVSDLFILNLQVFFKKHLLYAVKKKDYTRVIVKNDESWKPAKSFIDLN